MIYLSVESAERKILIGELKTTIKSQSQKSFNVDFIVDKADYI